MTVGPPLKFRFWGVRGSIPVPGAETSAYGGNTSCLEVKVEGQPSLVLDCGTGARSLGRELLTRQTRELHLVFSHFHMDHLFGFPFFAPIFAPSFDITVTAPMFSPDQTRDRIGRYLNGVFHPLRIREAAARLTFDAIRPNQPFERGPYQIQGVRLNHPGGACGYRVDYGGRSVVYITDTAPLSRPNEGVSGGLAPNALEKQLIEILSGADAVVFDTMFSLNEYLEKMSWGHSYPEYAVDLCNEARVRNLYLFHHAPDATDAELDELASHWAAYRSPSTELRIHLAREGLEVNLEG